MVYSILSVISILALANVGARATCDCGYTVNKTESGFWTLFTELFETDFLHVKDVYDNIGWIPQNYNTSAVVSNGPYGMAKETSNLVPNYISKYDWTEPGAEGGDPGLQLWVREGLVGHRGNRLVPSAEIVSERDDILYGSFRIAMKTTAFNGTCAAFYFYRNDSQEVDLEILSAEQNDKENSWPVHLVVQNTIAEATLNYSRSSEMIYQMAFPPGGASASYNEYRFDWLPDRIDYYINSHHIWTTQENIPSTPGRIHFSHWSNGNPYWTRGPPSQDAVMTVSYVKAYFNCTNATRTAQYNNACPLPKNTCQIPDQKAPPNPFGPVGNSTGHSFFFTHNHMATNQTIYDDPLDSSSSGLNGLEMIARILLVPALLLACIVAYF